MRRPLPLLSAHQLVRNDDLHMRIMSLIQIKTVKDLLAISAVCAGLLAAFGARTSPQRSQYVCPALGHDRPGRNRWPVRHTDSHNQSGTPPLDCK